ncbi:MAG: DEAD/DEAH box helicase [Gammaproteobacteria bacterium]
MHSKWQLPDNLMTLNRFHPAVANWFRKTFPAPTAPQVQAWPEILAGRHTLIAAPTGSGKTLAAFLAAIDALLRQGLAGQLTDQTQVVYVSPLKALSNDIHKNLEIPLSGIRAELEALGLPDVEIRTLVRTGDTPTSERLAMRRRPPHIAVTTPESLYVLLTSESGRDMLKSVHTVIVDEIHALAANKRGAHLALSLERLEALTARRLTRIGLSATQRPIEEVARFLTGASGIAADDAPDCAIIDSGHIRQRDLALEVPGSPLEAVMSGEVWQQVYDRLAALSQAHRTTLIFVNTRRMAERVTRHLSERLGEEHVASHHGSLSREQRLDAEQRLKQGALRVLVATASLELGIDIGDVDLVCQLASPRSIAAFLQRVGRSGHSLDAIPKGRLFPLSRDDLVECAALLDSVRRGELDSLIMPEKPLDVLAQQIVAEVASREWQEDELYECLRRAWPYHDLSRADFDALIHMLAEGFSTRHGRRSAYLHRDSVNRQLRARRGARLTALTSGGTIPDNADYQVILEPEGHFIGTLNEDFAVESMAGDIFQLGNHSYRILRIEAGRVRVEDAHGQPPTIPFWIGEAPSRSDQLSLAVSRLRNEMAQRLTISTDDALRWLAQEVEITGAAAAQLVEYLASAQAALGVLPSQDTVVLERFFDESGGMQLIVHSPFGSRINRAWGLALRKRFCRTFNFELQAAATEDAIVLSLTATHSFALDEVARHLNAKTVRPLLVQALLDAPMFTTRWRWDASIALALPRFRGGKKTPPQLQRMIAEDLIALVFPDQRACLENIVGDREIPDHPLVRQTIHDCLHEAMDIEGLERLLAALERGDIRAVARDLAGPSPLAQEILTARPYAYLDDAPLEERRTQAVMARRWLDPETASDLGRLDPEAIQRVRDEVWPEAASADELHDALVTLGFVTAQEGMSGSADWRPYLADLSKAGRATVVHTAPDQPALWIAVERLPQFQAIYNEPRLTLEITPPSEYLTHTWSRESALVEIVRGRLEGLGPVTVAQLAQPLGLPVRDIEAALLALEGEGFVLRGSFTSRIGDTANDTEWCERRLLARIHRYTLKRLRQEIEPVSSADFMRFLFHWQRVIPELRGEGGEALSAIIEQLEGFEAQAAAWEGDILPARINSYESSFIDSLCLSGRIVWARLTPPRTMTDKTAGSGPVRTTPIALLSRHNLAVWNALASESPDKPTNLSASAHKVADYLTAHGASFFDDLAGHAGLLQSQLEEALGELVAAGQVSADSFSGLRALLTPADRRRPLAGGRRHHRGTPFGLAEAGRWGLLKRNGTARVPEPAGAQPRPWSGGQHDPETVEFIAHTLLRRYGIVFRRVIEREAGWLPPWRELLWVYRRLEARGEIRGGRFVAGFSGEQYALPEAVGSLRDIRRQAKDGATIALCGADPLNLAGIITPGPKIPALAANRVLYRDGVPVAIQIAGEVRFMDTVNANEQWDLKNTLLKCRVTPRLGGYSAR